MASDNKNNNRAVAPRAPRHIDPQPRRGRSRGRVENNKTETSPVGRRTRGQARGQRQTPRGRSTPPSPAGPDRRRPPRSPSTPPMPDEAAWTGKEIKCTKNTKVPVHDTKSLLQFYGILLRVPPLTKKDTKNLNRPSLSPQLVDLIWETLKELSAENGGGSVPFAALLNHAALASSKSYLLHFFFSLGWYETASTYTKNIVLLTPIFDAAEPDAAQADGNEQDAAQADRNEHGTGTDTGTGTGTGTDGSHFSDDTLVDPRAETKEDDNETSESRVLAAMNDGDKSQETNLTVSATAKGDTTDPPSVDQDDSKLPAAPRRGDEPEEATVTDTEAEQPTDSDETEQIADPEIEVKVQAVKAELSQLRFLSKVFTGEPPFTMTEEHEIIMDATNLIADAVELRKGISEKFFGESAITDVSRIEQLRTSHSTVLGVEAEARSIRALALLQSGEFQVAYKQCTVSLEAIQNAGLQIADKDRTIGKLQICLCFASLALGDLKAYSRWKRAANIGENKDLLLQTAGPTRLLQEMKVAFPNGSLDTDLTNTKLRDLVVVADEFLVLMPDSVWMQVCKTRILFKLRFWQKSRAFLEEVAAAVYQNPNKLLVYTGDLESDNPYSCLVQDLGPDKILQCFLDPILAKAYIRNLIISNRSGTAVPLLKESGGAIAAQEIASSLRLDEYLPILRKGANELPFAMFEWYMQQCQRLEWDQNFAEDFHSPLPSETGMLSLYLRACKAIRILNDRNNGTGPARTPNRVVVEAMQLAESCLGAYGYYRGGPTNFEKPFPVEKVTDILADLIRARVEELQRGERYFDEWKDRGLILQLAIDNKFGFSPAEVETLKSAVEKCLGKCTDSQMLGESIEGKTRAQIKKMVQKRKGMWHPDKNGQAKWCDLVCHRLDKI